jgi:nucleoside-diphosphate-sugar epimerase
LFVSGIGHGAWGQEDWKKWGLSDWRTADFNLKNLITYGGEPDVIIHCAGIGSVPFSMSHPVQDFQITVQTTMDVLEFAIHPLQKLCFLPAPPCMALSISCPLMKAPHSIPFRHTDFINEC